MPPSKKPAPADAEAPLKKGETVTWTDSAKAVHEAVCLADEDSGKVQVALTKSRGQKPALPFVLLKDAADVTRL